ncbi:MAG TPA: electron transfer flavoprotein subunit alpha/FixB family protein [Nitrososphaerales archaeon]|nr:electron transfer flavoprotein subunit alpha/FixB family protein [Nitrososphaerales archaeon]
MPTTGGVFVFLEQVDGVVEDSALEVLGKGREIADRLEVPLVGVLLGAGVVGLAEECAERGADVVLVADSPLLKDFTAEAYARVMARIVRESDPDILLIGATHNGTAMAGMVAVHLGAGLMAHVVDLEVEAGTGMLLGSVPGFGGSIVAVCRCKKGRPQMATVRPGVFVVARPGGKKGVIEQVDVGLKPEDVKCRVVERAVSHGASVAKAERVVVAGLGCKDALALPKQLAEATGSTFGVSRPLADKGLAPKNLVVGSTGSSLNAKLVVVVGVSGAAHFASGLRNVGTVVAVNSDPAAEIFKHADYCVVGDASKVVPRLLTELGGENK